MTAIEHRCDTKGGGWNLDTLQEHWDAVHKLEAAWNEKWLSERDRRYAEVDSEREKAVQIKEKGDGKALDLAREIQIYKDEKANQLREQIGSERGTYATKDDLASAIREVTATIQPLTSARDSAQGATHQASASIATIVAIVAVVYGIVATVGTIILLIGRSGVVPH